MRRRPTRRKKFFAKCSVLDDEAISAHPPPADTYGVLPLAQEGKLSGIVFVMEICSWEADMQKFVRVVADSKLGALTTAPSFGKGRFRARFRRPRVL